MRSFVLFGTGSALLVIGFFLAMVLGADSPGLRITGLVFEIAGIVILGIDIVRGIVQRRRRKASDL